MAEDDGRRRERTLVELHKEGMRVRLARLARLRTRSPQDAEDLVQTALAKVFDPKGSPWDPDGSVSFFMHVGSVINGLAANAQRSWRAQHEVVDSNLARDDKAVDPAPLADQALEEHQELVVLRRLGNELLAELDRVDETAANVFRAAFEGIEGAAGLAAKARCRPDEVHGADRRIKYLARRILERDRGAEVRPLPELRHAGQKAHGRESIP
jgi:DNA-directed RNA polymerase specialized sigma24 family protein